MKPSSLVLAFVTCLFMVGQAAAQSGAVLRVGVDGAYPPFSHQRLDGTIAGFDIDITDALCRTMRTECELVAARWDNLIPALRGGKVDAVVASISISDERRELVDFSDPYYVMPSAIAVRQDTLISGTAPEDLAGSRLGAVTSTVHATYGEALLPDAEIALYDDAEDYRTDLANGRIDGVIDNPLILTRWIDGGLAGDGGNCCKLLGTLAPDPAINGEGVAIAVRKGEDGLRQRINEALAKIIADGTHAAIAEAYFAFEILAPRQ